MRGAWRSAAAVAALALAGVGCGRPDGAEAGSAAGLPAGAYSLDGRSTAPLPERFGVGRPATDAEIARVDVDVMPDGRGLPPGEGGVAEGERIYSGSCAICHGAELEGTPLGARLVPPADHPDFPDGEDPASYRAIGNYWPYATTLFDYIRRAMPFDRPGSLSDAQVYAVTAYLLHRNGIVPEDAVMDARTLPAVIMPARDRFVADDRLESDRVR